MILKPKFDYKILQRKTTPQGRQYVGDDNVPVPSVTTILDKTSDKTALIAWRKRVGDEAANKISRQASARGKLIVPYRALKGDYKAPPLCFLIGPLLISALSSILSPYKPHYWQGLF